MPDPSSMFGVTHACGHVELHPYLLPPEEEARYHDRTELLQARERALVRLEQQDCVNCYSRGDVEDHLERLRRLGVPLSDAPVLIGGTDKQTRWARKIRSSKLDDIIAGYQVFRDHLDEQQRSSVISAQEATRRRQCRDLAIQRVVDQTDPEWWIEQRTVPGWDLVRRAAHDC